MGEEGGGGKAGGHGAVSMGLRWFSACGGSGPCHLPSLMDSMAPGLVGADVSRLHRYSGSGSAINVA